MITSFSQCVLYKSPNMNAKPFEPEADAFNFLNALSGVHSLVRFKTNCCISMNSPSNPRATVAMTAC